MSENYLEATVYKRSHKALLAFSKRVVIVLSCAMFLKNKIAYRNRLVLINATIVIPSAFIEYISLVRIALHTCRNAFGFHSSFSSLNDNLFITQFNLLSDAYDNFAGFYVALRSYISESL